MLDNILSHPEARIDAIDMYTLPNFWNNVAASGGLDKTQHWRSASMSVLKTLPVNAFDFVYIDGSHSTIHVLEDAVLSFRLVKPDGILARVRRLPVGRPRVQPGRHAAQGG